ncbi:hypothetical protein DUNSADRAFT_16362 [Dunaliella salina]|uniref:Encoded protein n=1 Tax=Dunaliella salina TaxID=3046 RepID=A0ABQ7G405_DUNSA|nr:hypothetical protein DUNSADRAFT_16362 [Dunaliella salina]|eukprot:KAF5829249.1 hypothetical protein DUNSADRAFT_16362 [Dunaliella salina]
MHHLCGWIFLLLNSEESHFCTCCTGKHKKEAKQNLDKDHAALEATSGIFGDRGGYVRHELELAEHAGVDDNIVCEQFSRLFCGQHTSLQSYSLTFEHA